MNEVPMGDMGSSASNLDIGGMSGMSNKPESNNSGGNEKKEKSADEKMVANGADLALQANGVPPPASTMIGEKVGEAYTKAKDSLDVGKKIESGLNTALGAADIMSKGAEPKEAKDGTDAAKAGTNKMASNADILADNPVKEILNSASEPTEKESAKAEEGQKQESKIGSSMKMGR